MGESNRESSLRASKASVAIYKKDIDCHASASALARNDSVAIRGFYPHRYCERAKRAWQSKQK